MTWNVSEAIEICRQVEAVCPPFGFHVALTGGTLYKDGERKDLDLLFYSIRQNDDPDRDGLLEALGAVGFSDIVEFGWMNKATVAGKPVDIFFPEHPKSDDDGFSGRAPAIDADLIAIMADEEPF